MDSPSTEAERAVMDDYPFRSVVSSIMSTTVKEETCLEYPIKCLPSLCAYPPLAAAHKALHPHLLSLERLGVRPPGTHSAGDIQPRYVLLASCV